jgi:hypothetical protein
MLTSREREVLYALRRFVETADLHPEDYRIDTRGHPIRPVALDVALALEQIARLEDKAHWSPIPDAEIIRHDAT